VESIVLVVVIVLDLDRISGFIGLKLQFAQVQFGRTLGKIQNLNPNNLVVGIKIQDHAGRYLFRFNKFSRYRPAKGALRGSRTEDFVFLRQADWLVTASGDCLTATLAYSLPAGPIVLGIVVLDP
jgi:hypothetical protein